jgi:hypothetical protein
MILDDTRLQVRPAPETQQVDIFFDEHSYSAFPHVVSLGGQELLVAFRQAPRECEVRHTHPRSIITVMRSYDNGLTWDADGAAQLAAGGGQEFGILYLGGGKVVGALAKHEVVSRIEAVRSRIPHDDPHEYPFCPAGGYWIWSDNYGLTWPLENARLVKPKVTPSAAPICLNGGTILMPTYGCIEAVPACSALLFRSSDLGVTWSQPIVMGEGIPQTREYNEPGIVELEPGHVLCLHRTDAKPGTFWWNESFDGGLTWTEPEDTGIISGACPRLRKVADGRVLLTFGRRMPPFAIRAMLSDDGGKTWGDTAWVLRETPDCDQGYSSSIQIEDGRVFTACYAQNAAGVTGIVGTYWRLP